MASYAEGNVSECGGNLLRRDHRAASPAAGVDPPEARTARRHEPHVPRRARERRERPDPDDADRARGGARRRGGRHRARSRARPPPSYDRSASTGVKRGALIDG
jgi:hypothetical protein